MGSKAKNPRKKSSQKSIPSTKWQDRKTALITGASTGIGYELSKIFAREGYNAILVARNRVKLGEVAKELERLYGISTKVVSADLSLSSAPEKLYREIAASEIFIDVLVNNAGIGTFGPFHQTSLKSELELIQLNIASLAHLTKLFLPQMLSRRFGKILNVASTAAFQPGPFMSNYYASKAYVVSFSVALASELKGKGVSVSVLCPGPTRSEFHKRANMENSGLMKLPFMESYEVAQKGFDGLMKGKTVIIPGTLNKIGATLGKISPMQIGASIVKIIQSRRRR